MESTIQAFFHALSIPWIGLTSVGLFSFLSATLLPLSSEVPFYAYLSHFPENLIQLLFIATLGNSLGGVVNWWIGKLSRKAFHDEKKQQNPKLIATIQKFGPKSLLMSWVPLIGDPLTAIAGWYQLPLVPCCFYMTIGKFLRYLVIALLYLSTQSS
jgi:membrane protein YqaA with SNARE-associated domain